LEVLGVRFLRFIARTQIGRAEPSFQALSFKLARLRTLRTAPRAPNSTLNGVFYVVGGYFPYGGVNGGAINEVWAYTPGSGWAQRSPMSAARSNMGVAAVNGTLYAIGGVVGPNISGVISGSVEAYDPVANTWTQKSPMPTARASVAVAVACGLIYAIGGGNNSTNLTTVEIYDPATDTWAAGPSLPMAIGGAGGAFADGMVYVGGGNNASGPVATLEAL
jgi:N-acetylneuraminic acid mutarotase